MQMSDNVKCKSFVSESEIEELKKKRQEEWDKVRKPDDPLEAPEEPYDPRSLYERLQEQKERRELELEEGRRLKNLIRGLDDDEVSFLELVDQTKLDLETRLWEEEQHELQEYRQAVSCLSAEEQEVKLQNYRRSLKLRSAEKTKKSQQALLAGAVKRKASAAFSPEKKEELNSACAAKNELSEPDTKEEEYPRKRNAALVSCLGILPGLGVYSDSSDSENSSNSEVERDDGYDLIGRHINIQAVAQAAVERHRS